MQALVFIAEGDMRNALNALQSTVSGFGHVTAENVFKVCDMPQPGKVKVVVDSALAGNMSAAQDRIINLFSSGYAATDIIQTLFKV